MTMKSNWKLNKGTGTNEIATEQEVYNFATPGPTRPDPVDGKYCTKVRAHNLGCDVNGSYTSTQLVKYSDLVKRRVNTTEEYGYYWTCPISILDNWSYGDYQGNKSTIENFKSMILNPKKIGAICIYCTPASHWSVNADSETLELHGDRNEFPYCGFISVGSQSTIDSIGVMSKVQMGHNEASYAMMYGVNGSDIVYDTLSNFEFNNQGGTGSNGLVVTVKLCQYYYGQANGLGVTFSSNPIPIDDFRSMITITKGPASVSLDYGAYSNENYNTKVSTAIECCEYKITQEYE